MVMPDWFVLLIASCVVSFQGWLAIKVVDQGRKLVELESRLVARENACIERVSLFDELFQKINKVDKTVERILGVMTGKVE